VGGKTLAGITLKYLPESLRGKAMADNGLKIDHNIIVLLVEDADGNPNDVHANTVLKENDRITVLGDYNTICRIFHARERFVELEP
jgi:Trk K+ transport system NAD-binding subunit